MSFVRMIFSININAPKQRVWDVLLGEKTYREWTSAFSPSSRFEGDWSEGSRMRFVGNDENGNLGGLSSRIVTNRPFECIAIEHLAAINNGVEEAPGSSDWAGAREDYYFSEAGGVTTLRVEQDMVAQCEAMFLEFWPNALAILKALAEKKS
jgi:uncharacterized protein YndB with AHSA1/START domain